MRIALILCPTRLKKIAQLFGKKAALAILDIGCGNHSPSITKHWFPNCTYTGVDVEEFNLDAEDKRCMDRFIRVNTDGTGYEQIPEASFDVILLNHVIEHIRDPAPVIASLCRKLKPGGYIYLAFPSMRSLSLPSADGTLNFCDDAGHIHIVDIRAVAQTLLDNRVRILRAGRSIDRVRYCIGAALYPLALIRKAVTGRMNGHGLWYFTGFEDMVLGQLRAAPEGTRD